MEQKPMQPEMMVCSFTSKDVNLYNQNPPMTKFLTVVRAAADIANNAIEKAKNESINSV